MFFLDLLLMLGSATLLACWCGWGLVRLALPASLREHAGLLTPLVGYALAMLVGYWFVWTVSGLLVPLVVLLVGAGALNLLAWRKTGPPRLGLLREEWPLLLLLLATLLVGLAPLLHYGHPAVIGGGWDIETALPTAHYLEHGPIRAIANAPANPLRDLVEDPPRIGKTIGFAVWQGMLDILTRHEPILTFTPLIAWLRVLGVLAVYLLFRATLGLRRGAALLGAALASAGPLMLWIGYFNFEKQLSAWPLIPLGLLLGIAAIEDLTARGLRAAWPGAITAAVGLAALPVSYYPAMTLWLPLMAGLWAALLPVWQPIATVNGARVRAILHLFTATLVLLALTIVFAAPTLLDYWHGFSYRYNEQLTTLGVFAYIPATDVLGLTPYLHGQTEAAPRSLRALLGLVIFGVLALLGLVLSSANPRQPPSDTPYNVPYRLRWLGLLLGALAFLAWLRWIQQYPYAYLKGAAYVGFVFVGLAAAGWQALAARTPKRARLPLVILPLLLFVPMLAGQLQIVRQHWAGPGLYPADFPALLELRTRIPAGSTVTLADDAQTTGVTSGLAAYLLDHTVVDGSVKTGYTSSASGAPDLLSEYALLPNGEDASAWGYGEPIWRGGSYKLYQRPSGALAHLRLDSLLDPGASLALAVGESHLALGDAALPAGPPRQLVLAVAALQDTSMSVDGASFAIPAGGAQLRLAALPIGRTLTLKNSGAAPLLLRSATLAASGEAQHDGVAPLPATLITSAATTANGQTLKTTLDTLLVDGGPVTLALDVWDRVRGTHYGWYGVEVGTNARPQTTTFTLDLRNGTAVATGRDGAVLPSGAQFVGLQAGDYSARLQVSAGAALLSTSGDVFSFHVAADQAISNIQTAPLPFLITTTARPQHPLDLAVGDDVWLQGYALDRTSAQPGESLLLTLWWQARAAPRDERSVLIQVLDSMGVIAAQADGPPARGSRSTSQWRAGETVIDSHQIALSANLPPGSYTLIFGMYRWPSLERLALRNADARQPDDVVRIPITVTSK